MNATSLLLCVLCSFMLFCTVTVRSQCPADSNLPQPANAWDTLLYKYSSVNKARSSNSDVLTFMTFNIRSGYLFNCVNDVAAQIAVIRQADYIGTQETVQNVDTRCNCNIPKRIADEAGMDTRFVMAIPYRTGQYGISAGTTQTILDTKFITMAYTGYEHRAVVALRTQPLALQGRNLWFINTHVEYYNLDVRMNQLNKVIAFVNETVKDDPNAVVVITGDFNGGPWDNGYKLMNTSNFVNTWGRFSGNCYEGGNTIPADWPGTRLDHIWYRAPKDVQIAITNAEVLNVRLSDHRPYLVKLKFTVPSSSSTPTPTTTPTTTPTCTPSSPSTPAPPTAAPTTRPTDAPTVAPTTSPTEEVICVGPIPENQNIVLKCPKANQVMSSVQFASFGTPTGSCGNFQLGSCIGGSSVAVVKDKCVNRNSCTFPNSVNVFGDPCSGRAKTFVAQVLCKSN
jgi:endonuclease/exonuclease/phosphatase family metal-dependent hydrolase